MAVRVIGSEKRNIGLAKLRAAIKSGKRKTAEGRIRRSGGTVKKSTSSSKGYTQRIVTPATSTKPATDRTYYVSSEGDRSLVSQRSPSDTQPRGQANAVTEIDTQQAAEEFAKRSSQTSSSSSFDPTKDSRMMPVQTNEGKISTALSETGRELYYKQEAVRSDYKRNPTLKSAVKGGILLPVAMFGVGVAKGATSVAHAITHPVQTVKGISYAVTHPLETSATLGQQFKMNPAGTIGEFVGIGGAIKAVSKTARLGAGRVRSTGAKYVPPEKVFDPKVVAGESTFPTVSSPSKAHKQFQKGGTVVHTTADFPTGLGSKIKRKTTGTVDITKTKIADPNVAGLYGSPKGRASPAFLRLDKASAGGYSDITLLPKWKAPKIVELTPKTIERTPRGILMEDLGRVKSQGRATRLKSSEEFISAKAEEGTAILGTRLELGLTAEPEAILGVGGSMKQIGLETVGSNIRGYSKYTKYKPKGKFFSEIIPIEEFVVKTGKPSKTPRVKSEFGIKGGKYDVGSSSAVKPSRSVAGLGSELSILSGSSSKLFGSSSKLFGSSSSPFGSSSSPYGSSSKLFGSSSRVFGSSSSPYGSSSRVFGSSSSPYGSSSRVFGSGVTGGSSVFGGGVTGGGGHRRPRWSGIKFKPQFKTFASPTAVLFNIKASKRQRKRKKFTGLEIIGLR